MSRAVIKLGVDLVSIDRVKSFIKRHPEESVKRLFTDREANHLKKNRYSPVMFSKYLAAKEAFFKASDKSWMGLEGFKKIEVSPLQRNRFHAKWRGDKTVKGDTDGTFFRKGDCVGAQVVVRRSH